MDQETSNYRQAQCKRLKPSEYAFTIQLTDGNGGKTNNMNINAEEYKEILRTLTGKECQNDLNI